MDDIDLSDLLDKPGALSFDDTPQQTTYNLTQPATLTRQEAQRRFVNGMKKQALSQLVPELPPPGTDLYIIGNGNGAERVKHHNPQAFDFGTFIPHVVNLLGDLGVVAYVSSWAINRDHVLSMLNMLTAGQLAQLTVFSDTYFQRRSPAVANTLIAGLRQHGQRYLAFDNHVKCIALAAPNGRCCTITGSANLSSQPRAEQYILTTAPEVYAFFKDEFFEAMFKGEKAL